MQWFPVMRWLSKADHWVQQVRNWYIQNYGFNGWFPQMVHAMVFVSWNAMVSCDSMFFSIDAIVSRDAMVTHDVMASRNAMATCHANVSHDTRQSQTFHLMKTIKIN